MPWRSEYNIDAAIIATVCHLLLLLLLLA